MEARARTLDELTLGASYRLEELVARDVLREMLQSFWDLFRVPCRVLDADGGAVADAGEAPELYAYLDRMPEGRRALAEVVQRARSTVPAPGEIVTLPCVTGAIYRIAPIVYDERALGRLVLGPFVSPSLAELPRALLALDPEIEANEAARLLAAMPRAREETVAQVMQHLLRSLELVLFSGHKALLTSNMHLASVRESYRELSAKNAKLQEAFDRLKELDRLKSNFLATVSHELRTPLTSIIGYSEMLHEGIAGDLTEEQRDFVRTIREKGEQLLELIKSLLDLSKLESGTLSIRRADVAVGPLIEDVVATLTPTARKKGVELSGGADGSVPTLHGDSERLRQVLLNLAENAIKFTPAGGRVSVSAAAGSMTLGEAEGGAGAVLFARQRPAVILRVADTGIGIPESERTKVFDAFYQVDQSSTREAGGTGLGLSIVKRLVEAHEGTVRVEANQPRGTVFVVELPLKRPGA